MTKIYNSSLLSELSYFPDSRELHVVFMTNPSKVYIYQDVPPEIPTQILAASSQGSVFTNLIRRGGYQFKSRETNQSEESHEVDQESSSEDSLA